MSDEPGFTLVEMLLAAFVLIAGLAATFTVFSSSKNLTLVSQRHEVAVHQAQKEMEKLRALSYAELGLKSDPAGSDDPSNPGCRVTQSGTRLRVKPAGVQPCKQGASTDERFVLPDDVPEGVVEPGPETFYAGEISGSVVSGKIYRYITWRDENCAPGLCETDKNTKRLFVAVTIDPVTDAGGNIRSIGPRNPIWVTSIATDPNEATAAGQSGGGPPPPPVSTAQSFYLYDKRCSDDDANNAYSSPPGPPPATPPRPGDHETHDTAAPLTSCENADASLRPDLMGPRLPTYGFDPPLPPYKFSNELTGDFPAGLALSHSGAPQTCPASSYQLDSGNSDNENPPNTHTPGKWQVHAWATRKFDGDFDLNGRAFLSIWTTSVNTSAAAGSFCATLIDRLVTAGVPSDIILGSTSRTYTPWPTTKSEPGKNCGTADYPCGRQLTFQFSVSSDRVQSGSRLMLLLSVLGSSEKDLVLLYDDPRYRSFIQLETSTVCNSTGKPCPTT